MPLQRIIEEILGFVDPLLRRRPNRKFPLRFAVILRHEYAIDLDCREDAFCETTANMLFHHTSHFF